MIGRRISAPWAGHLIATSLWFACGLLSSGVAASAEQESPPGGGAVEGIRELLAEQQRAWNLGDIDGYMEGYWRSDELTFSAAGRVTRGFASTRARYHRKYSSPELMGRLAFSDLEIRPLGSDAAYVLGNWRLSRGSGEVLAGNFTLVLRRRGGAWRIMHDHTTERPAGSPLTEESDSLD